MKKKTKKLFMYQSDNYQLILCPESIYPLTINQFVQVLKKLETISRKSLIEICNHPAVNIQFITLKNWMKKVSASDLVNIILGTSDYLHLFHILQGIKSGKRQIKVELQKTPDTAEYLGFIQSKKYPGSHVVQVIYNNLGKVEQIIKAKTSAEIIIPNYFEKNFNLLINPSQTPTTVEELIQTNNAMLDWVYCDRSNAIEIFHKICIYIVDNYRVVNMEMDYACGIIAGTILCIPEILYDDDSQYVHGLAFELELPDGHLGNDRQVLWQKMNDVINSWRDLNKNN